MSLIMEAVARRPVVCASLSFDRASVKPITQLLPRVILMKAD